MKKQIAVLMAAATAVTTVAPALAHADSFSNVSANIVAKAKEALSTRYAGKDENGIIVPNGNITKDYVNSQYIVLVNVPGKEDGELMGLYPLSNPKAGYKQFGNKLQIATPGKDNQYFTPESSVAKKYYVVTDATKLQNILEQYSDAKVYIVKKSVGANNKSFVETANKHYVIGTAGDVDVEESLNDAYKELAKIVKASYLNSKRCYIKSLSVTTQNGDNDITVNPFKVNTTENGEKNEENLLKDYAFLNAKDNENKNKYDLPKIKEGNDELAIRKIKVELQSGEKFTLEANSEVIDFAKTYKEKADSANEIKLFNREANGNITVLGENTEEVIKQIKVLGRVENDGDYAGQKVTVMATAPGFDYDQYTLIDQVPEVLELKNIYTREGGYTQEGADFVNSIIKARKGGSDFSFNFRGVNYILDGTIDFSKATINTSGKGYVLSFPVKVKNANDLAMSYTLRFEIYGDSQKDLFDVLRDLQGKVEVVTGHFTKLAGSNRYATAIAVSQEQFKPETADSVVIVGGYAQMDGLAAAPLASAKNAPILLADPKTGLSNDTMNEIKRACKSLKNRTVYIVGGPHSVPMSVEKQLEKEFGAVVVRSYGVDRNATSLAVARRLFYDGQTNDKVFVVGRDGGADAMGVASVASRVKDINADGQLAAQKAAINVMTSKTQLGDYYSKEYTAKADNEALLEKVQKAQATYDKAREAYDLAKAQEVVLNKDKDIFEALANASALVNNDDNKNVEEALKKDANEISKLVYINIFVGTDEAVAKTNVENVLKKERADKEKVFAGYDSLGDADKAVYLGKIASMAKTNLEKLAEDAMTADRLSTLSYETKKTILDAYKAYKNDRDASKVKDAIAKVIDDLNIGDPKSKGENAAGLRKALDDAKNALEIKKTEANDANNKAKLYDKEMATVTEIDKNAIKYTQLNGRTVSPIIVVNKNSMDRVTRDFIREALNNKDLVAHGVQAYIIGGENSVSTNVRRELKTFLADSAITRLAGKDRYETNVDVINNFYTSGNVGGAVFTSGEDKYLVDSQTAGFFASSKNAPIVLTSNKLTSSQVDLMKKHGVLYEQRAGIYQVGGVVSADVMKNVVQLLGL